MSMFDTIRPSPAQAGANWLAEQAARQQAERQPRPLDSHGLLDVALTDLSSNVQRAQVRYGAEGRPGISGQGVPGLPGLAEPFRTIVTSAVAWADQEAAKAPQRPGTRDYRGPAPQLAAPDNTRRNLLATIRRTADDAPATGSLTPADFALLNLLPLDPEAFTAEHVSWLVEMSRRTADVQERRLLAARLEPVRRVYEREEERVRLSQVVTSPPPLLPVRDDRIRARLVDALTAAVQAEVPELRESEARGRAVEMINDARRRADEVAADHARRVAAAQARLADLDTPRPAVTVAAGSTAGG